MVRQAFVVLAVLWAMPAFGQATTNCQTFGNRTQCQTTNTGQEQQQNNQAAGNFGTAIGTLLAPKKKKQATEANYVPVKLDTSSGNGYLAMCEQAERNPTAWGVCYGYIDGFIEREAMNGKNAQICLPSTSTNSQLLDTFLAYLRQNPGQRHRSVGLLLFVSMSSSFPCPEQK